MFENSETSAISDDYAVHRMFELVQCGQTDGSEYALLDALIQSRLRQAYPVDENASAPRVQTAD